jgi:ribonuclease D
LSRQSVDLEIAFVDNPDRLAAAVDRIRRASVLGLDTEFVGEATYEPQLCLIQVSTGDMIFVIDPLARLDLRDFWSAVTTPDVEVVAFAARAELLFCLRYSGHLPGTVFDPQVAAGLVGYGYPLSHTKLVEQVLNLHVEGSEAYTDWRQRPLSSRQLEYAADDVRHLLAMREKLVERAQGMGRLGWLRSECDHLAERVAQSKRQERWSRISGASRLNRRELAVLRELWRWRDNTARAADLTPRRILGDDLLVEITKRCPRSNADLFALRGMNRPALRQAGARIIAAVQAGLNVPEEELPASPRRDDPPQVAILGQLASILANSLAVEHQVDAAMLATTSELQEFIRWRLGLSEEAAPLLLEGWRGEILGQPLVELLEGKRSVRVADVRSSSPLHIEPL